MNRLKEIAARLGWQLAPERMLARAAPRTDPRLDEVYCRRGLVLIHIPKNAGTSVEDALFGYRVRHRTWREIRDTCPRAWETLPKIAIIRDPVDRFLSAFDYLKSGGRNATDRSFGAAMIGGRPLETLLDRLEQRRAFRDRAMRYFHFRPQADYVCAGEAVMVDHLIPFHRMAEGLSQVADVPPDALRHSNRTAGRRTRRDDLSETTLRRIRALYAADVALHEAACAAWDGTVRGASLVAE